jgi:hypothetical protein
MNLPGLLLSLDVSSAAIGCAYFDGDALLTFGVIDPEHASDGSVARIDAMVERLRAHVDLNPPGRVVMEWSTGKIHARLAKKRRAEGKPETIPGQAVLGQAQGSVRQMLRERALDPELIGENTWTGREPKNQRAYNLGLKYPKYASFQQSGQDKGYDAADAIGLGLWWLYRAKLVGSVIGTALSSRPGRCDRGRRR